MEEKAPPAPASAPVPALLSNPAEAATSTASGSSVPTEGEQPQSTDLPTSLPPSPFANLKLAKVPENLRRAQCPQCKSRKLLYCPECQIPLEPFVPRFDLPIHCDVIHHPQEKRTKSTAIHAAVLCPDHVTIHEFPSFPAFDPTESVLLYPCPEARSLHEIDLRRVKRVVFIDSTWQKAGSVLHHPTLANIPRVKIEAENTAFWRYQDVSPHCLATIEAIYYFFREFANAKDGRYEGQYDNLLYFFSYYYDKIQSYYRSDPSLKFSKIDGYIKY
ncbi:putative DTW domain protein [Paratrimastix pyriformis]|uniref:tRNA-uridine aminocarboxypropyltransferase 1 n=1 Tax=Paratrimastix pyriformis TaxID=342808 RepID=A0ABQ8UQR1_9EUKA|nr:putative DTW domain protein [Paratrimastix pyriformis]